MSTQHNAPSGFTFTLRDPEDVPERLRRPVERKLVTIMGHGDLLKATGLTPEIMDDNNELDDLLVVALVEKWSAEAPVSVEAIQDLPTGDVKALRKAAAPFIWQMFPDFEVTPEDGTPTPP